MTNLQDILKLDLSYYETFSKRKDTGWGTIFYNENQPTYYDANHAHLMDECIDPVSVINEVVNFFQSKNIVPRFYIHNLNLQQNLISELLNRNFRYEEIVAPIQIWNNRVTEITHNHHVTIEKVTEENYQEALVIEVV